MIQTILKLSQDFIWVFHSIIIHHNITITIMNLTITTIMIMGIIVNKVTIINMVIIINMSITINMGFMEVIIMDIESGEIFIDFVKYIFIYMLGCILRVI
jgi:hypothetical protein